MTLADVQLPFGAENGLQSRMDSVIDGDSPTVAYLNVGELFAGAGGMALGASMAKYAGIGFRHVWATDNNRDACDTFRLNVEIDKSRVICKDVEDLDFNRLSPIDGLIFGFPCNDFSVVGEKKGISGRFGGLYRYGVKALRHFKPKFFVAENVSGLTSVNKNADFERIVSELAGEGYEVSSKLYKFEEYGVPQRRHRVIIVGFRSDLRVKFNHPEPTGERPITAAEALGGISEHATNNELTAQNPRVVERLKHIEPGENAFTADLPEHLRLNMRSGAMISQIYRRLIPDQPSYTITGSGGGGTHMYHWEEHRALTNRERARLQTFPDLFRFCGAKESVRKQIGMAVPPLGVKPIFEAVAKATLKEMSNCSQKTSCVAS